MYTWNNGLQHTATHCNTLQHTATLCNTLQHSATHCNTLHISLSLSHIHRGMRGPSHIKMALQHTATHCKTLQRTVTQYFPLSHTHRGMRGPSHMEDGMGLVCILGIMARVSLGYVPVWNNDGSFAWNVSIRVVCVYGILA